MSGEDGVTRDSPAARPAANGEGDDPRARVHHALPTSADVARLAGVSRAVVSVALSGRSGSTRISPATRERVLAAAAQLGYTPHPIGAALRRRSSQIILFVPRSVREKPYEHAIPYILSTSAMRALAAHGYFTIVVQPEEFQPAGTDGLVRLLHRYRIDGVLFDSPTRLDDLRVVVDRGIPLVQLMRPLGDVTTSTATVDPRPGICAAIEHLREAGHRRIAFVGQRGPHPTDVARVEAFRNAMRAADLDPGDSSVHLVNDYSIEAGKVAAARALASDPPPTAILTSSDGLTLGLLRLLYERRLHVPDDLSVVSFDDAAVADLYPPVTSITQPFAEVAERAVSLLLVAIGELDEPAIETPLPTRLTVRASTGAPRAQAVR